MHTLIGIMRVNFVHLRPGGPHNALICSVIEALRAQSEEPHDHLQIKQERTSADAQGVVSHYW
jgi:hypothetical protein